MATRKRRARTQLRRHRYGDCQGCRFVDGSFANNKDYSSQIGYVIVLADAKGNANILHWSSTKCKRITRSVLASKLYALANGFDVAATIRDMATQILQLMKPLPLVICTDSKSLYECLVKLGSTQEKRLMIDLMALREAFERKEINEVKWISGNSNPADAMTKAKPCAALSNLVNTNKLDLHIEGWTEGAESFQPWKISTQRHFYKLVEHTAGKGKSICPRAEQYVVQYSRRSRGPL